MQQTVLILGGNGKVGRHAVDAFWNAGWTVRSYKRGTDMVAAAEGVDVIVNGLNPPNYHNWGQIIPQITTEVIAAAKASGATVIIPGNIYNYGNKPGLLDEDTPQVPNTRKGKIRVAMEQEYKSSGVRTIVLRAGNFIDPYCDDDLMKAALLRDIGKDKLTTLGDPDAIQAYAYMPDWARAALALAEKRWDLPTFSDIPFPGHSFTTTHLRALIANHTQRDVRIVGFPWWMMKLLSPFWELAREMGEMRYLYDMPHQIGDRTFRRLLPDFVPTDLETVMLSGLPDDIDPNKMMRSGGQVIPAE
ncbi:epimerase [Yoonia sp. 2307UL14-13]|uniref:epimerase n=1 Tax=Yoonia sp. 2307UL14-13 TaxID=3126506 RepID=UPI0030A8CC5F